MSDINTRSNCELLPETGTNLMTAPVGATSILACIGVGIDEVAIDLSKRSSMIKVPVTRTNRIQEMHIAVGHMLCGFVEDALC